MTSGDLDRYRDILRLLVNVKTDALQMRWDDECVVRV
jgi:hypothetical protein